MLAPGNEQSNTCIFLSISKYQSTPGASGYFCKWRQRCNRNPPFHAFRDITWGSTIADPMLAAPWAKFLAPAKVHQWRSAKERRPLSTSFSSSSAKWFRDRLRGLHMWRAANCLSPGKARSRKSSDRKWCRSLKHSFSLLGAKEICYHTLQLHRPSSDHHSNHRKHMCSCRSLACRWCLWLLRDSDWNTFEKVPFSVCRTKELGANRRVKQKRPHIYLSEGRICCACACVYTVYVCLWVAWGITGLNRWKGQEPTSASAMSWIRELQLQTLESPGVSPIGVAHWSNPHVCLQFEWPNEILPISSIFKPRTTPRGGSWFGVNYSPTTHGRTATKKFERVVMTADKATTLSRPRVQVAC